MGHQMLLITALVLLIAGAVGYWKGFLKMALSIAAMVLSFAIVLALNPYVGGFLREKTSVYQNTKVAIMEVMENKDGEEETLEQEQKIEALSLPKSWKRALAENYSEDTLASIGAETFSEYVSSYLAGIVINVLAFALTFLIVFLGLHILMIAFDLIGKVPVIHGVNKIAGAAVGFLLGLVILWLFNMLIASAAATGTSWAVGMMEEIQKSSILSFLYNGSIFSELARILLS